MAVKAPMHPEPIERTHKPAATITYLPASAPIEDILKTIERDGGVILTNFATTEQIDAIDQEVSGYVEAARLRGASGIPIIPKETTVVPGLVGKSPTVAQLCESPVLDQIRTQILEDRFSVQREDVTEENIIDPLLSISVTLYVGPGAPRQRLHRDDNIHGIRHDSEFKLNKASQIGCLIAGCKTTRENGATIFIPGSHRWDDKRRPRADEVCFAGK
jgi:ectoine hydroxylase-related dioxygenase (phytanoyl-CoA dioxygenase family)